MLKWVIKSQDVSTEYVLMAPGNPRREVPGIASDVWFSQRHVGGAYTWTFSFPGKFAGDALPGSVLVVEIREGGRVNVIRRVVPLADATISAKAVNLTRKLVAKLPKDLGPFGVVTTPKKLAEILHGQNSDANQKGREE